MRVREVALRNVMSHADTRVVLPEVGLVVVTGSNGAGKSSLVEGVALAVWGKTLRGTPGWTTDAKVCSAAVRTDALYVERTRRGGKNALSWRPDEETEEGRAVDAALRLGSPERAVLDGTGSWESATQAQAALDRVVQSFDVWRRGCAFSASDAAHFSLATDGERKRLLEAILGIDRFDGALELCRADLRKLEAALADARSRAASKRAAVEQAERRLSDAREVLAEVTAGALEAAVDQARAEERRRLRALVAAGQEDARRLEALQRGHERAGGEHEAEARSLRAALSALEGGRCPSCEQEVPHEHLDGLRGRVAEATAAFAAARTEAARRKLLLEAQLSDVRGEVEALRERLQALDCEEAADAERRRQAAADRERRARAERTVREAEAALDGLRAELSAAEADLARDGPRRLVLQEAERVLGLKGVRAHVLARSLAGLDAVANAWLPRLGLPDLRVALRPYSEKKGGGVTDAIGVEVAGAGGGHGYRGTSAGERRRIDVALLVGIAEVAGAALGRSGSTLWFDELFDGLDEEGVEAASRALEELARDRAVVVVTHSPDLAGRLPARLRLRVERGRVVGPEEELALDAAARLGGEEAAEALLGAGGGEVDGGD